MLRHELRLGAAAADGEPLRALTYVSGEPGGLGCEALLAFGGQPAEKPDALALLPLPGRDQVVGRF